MSSSAYTSLIEMKFDSMYISLYPTLVMFKLGTTPCSHNYLVSNRTVLREALINGFICCIDLLLRTVHHFINTIRTVYHLISALVKTVWRDNPQDRK